MKNNAYRFLFGVLTTALFFIPAFASATTIYQQFTDGSGNVGLTPVIFPCGGAGNTGVVVAQFVATGNFTLDSGTAYFYFSNPGGSSDNTILAISPTSSYCDEIEAYSFGSIATTSSGETTSYSATGTGGGSLTSGVTYYIVGTNGNGTSRVVSNGANSGAFGYITDAGGSSVPVSPGIPGFTDVGISTSSQSANCNANFSTSSSPVTQVASDFSVALCNTGVFLFSPSLTAVANLESVPLLFQVKFPFSWIYGVQTDIAGLTASSTSNFTSYDFNLTALDIGSTTAIGNILPSFNGFSSTTVMTFIPAPVWDTGQLLIAGALWLGLFYFLFHDARARFTKV